MFLATIEWLVVHTLCTDNTSNHMVVPRDWPLLFMFGCNMTATTINDLNISIIDQVVTILRIDVINRTCSLLKLYMVFWVV